MFHALVSGPFPDPLFLTKSVTPLFHKPGLDSKPQPHDQRMNGQLLLLTKEWRQAVINRQANLSRRLLGQLPLSPHAPLYTRQGLSGCGQVRHLSTQIEDVAAPA